MSTQKPDRQNDSVTTDGSNDNLLHTTTNEKRGYRDRATLEELYLGRGLTTREIADLFDASNGTISRWLNRHGIPTRDNWRAGVEAAKRANRVERVGLHSLPSGYEFWSTKQFEGDDRVSRMVYVHRLLAVAEYGFDAVADMDVHHENGIPWDNRAENIHLLEKSEHGQLHSNEHWGNEVSA